MEETKNKHIQTEEEEDQEMLLQEAEAFYASGVEEEEEGDEEVHDPFDPDLISITSKVISMEACLRRLQQGTINLNPDFQRKEVWTAVKKSQLIESLILKIPLPMFYVSSDEKGNFTVVDGLQRLSTIRDFVLGQDFLNDPDRDESLKGKGFTLTHLEFWTEFNGKTFKELPIHLQNRILETEFSFTIINAGTPEEVKRNIFKRINTGGLPLSNQEVRNSLYNGLSTQLLKELITLSSFHRATAGSVRSGRMEDQELVLRMLAFLVRDYRHYVRTLSTDRYLSETMIILNAFPNFDTREFVKMETKGQVKRSEINLQHIQDAEKLFKIGMERAHHLFGRHCFRKSQGKRRRSPINKSLFEMWGVLLSLLDQVEYQNLMNNKEGFLNSYKAILSQNDFQIAISRDSMKANAVKYRFSKIENLINQFK